jgi:hypothetical protein
MHRRPAEFVVLALAQVMLCRTSTPAQISPHVGEVPSTRACLSPPASDERLPEPQVTVAELVFDKDLHLPVEEQDQIVSSVKQHTYSGGLDEATS